MNARAVLLLAALLLPALAGTGAPQGYAGLGIDAEGFAIPRRDRVLEFPRDHGAHPDFRIEWWYVTAALRGSDGRDYGVQWTLFRSALRPETGTGWQTPQLWMGHAAVTTPEIHLFAERLSRGGIGQAGVRADPFAAWIDEWRLSGPDFDHMTLSAAGSGFSYELRLNAEGPLVLHGESGYSVKSAQGQASHYYSQPFFRAEGRLDLPDGPVEVAGTAWLDREWSSQPLAADQTGWDWFSLVFEDGSRLMAFRLRGASHFTSGTWIDADGRATAIADGMITPEPLETADIGGRKVPVRWRLTLPGRDLDVEVVAVNRQAWMGTTFPYWEGPVLVTGSHAGRGYLEMTGYE